ncbi:RhoGAP domain protein [Aspergillus heteromorphus CBS 117.55]|uniref:RhoGAP domain protein n=1 Tax=Aspergillus heteromorphus CBS 117.55 TaxID=1448321 RepID=A0A317VP60_9EURO|nr:RhoGAP domain protein [Aspergillus heteromorphus CBS 117.55]PWY76164.1 RhoGAP domain protein [Aspergillus heteromorphus CBS 117.55]
MGEKMSDLRAQKGPDTADSHQSRMSSPISPANSIQSTPGNRPGQRMMPRTSSIDSAISSLSSASQSHKSSFDANALSQADIGNLIATAGSAEAVIIHLLKEKHHAASQNSQLWRLVDKQRTLIMGLNRDLERALKEKERYRKRLKEIQNSPPPLPVESKIQQPITETVGLPIRHEPSEKGQVQSQRVSLNHKHSSTQGHEFAQHRTPTGEGPDSSRSGNLQGLGVGELSAGLNKGIATTNPINHSDRSQKTPNIQSLVYTRQELAAVSPATSTSSSPTADNPTSCDEKQRVPHPARKPPPAPLSLVQTDHARIENRIVSDSDSEYDDILAANEFPVERGRRRTRDDDDREREAALARDRDTMQDTGAQGTNAHDSMNTQPAPDLQQTPPITYPESSASSPRMRQAGSFGHRLAITIPKSPGLPVSPRPEDRPLGSPLPRMPRGKAGSLPSLSMPSENNVSGLALSPRIGRYQTPLSTTPVSSVTTINGSTHNSVPVDASPRPIPSIDATVTMDFPRSPTVRNNTIYQGLVSEVFPDLLLPPDALPSIYVKVSSSRLRPSRNSYMASKPLEDEPVFTLGVFSRSQNVELWRIEKVIAALPQLEQQIRHLSTFGGKLPDRSIFSGHSPAKVDARRAALNTYFEFLLDTPMDDKAAMAICQFLTSDAIEPRDDEMSLLNGDKKPGAEVLRGPDGRPRKEGYLTKRGKNFGGWKARYFVLHGSELKYFESPGGPHLGTIKIYNAQIGKQSQSASHQSNSPSRVEEDSDNQYRHAFLILEPKRKDSSALVRHVLCAESDEERDAWVDALLEYVESQSENDGDTITPTSQTATAGKQSADANTNSRLLSNGARRAWKGADDADTEGPNAVQGFSYDDAVPAEPPVIGPTFDKQTDKSPVVSSVPSLDAADTTQDQAQPSYRLISGPTNGAVIHNAGAWGNKAVTSVKEKKRSIWGFRTRSSFDLASQLQATSDPQTSQLHNIGDRREFIRPVFGLALADAVQFCAPHGITVDLPAVVYRCVEYLKAKGAESEEGIFRLSGSNLVVKALKERFNTEGDVDFLADDQYHDVHAVASLFKQYLRELPTTVLTRELHLEFLRVLELHEKQQKIAAFNILVHRLPKPNLALLRALVQFLIIIVSNSDVNKMTIRNVGIVFAPTLNIPAPVFSMFLTDFEGIFDELPTVNTELSDLSVDHSTSLEDFGYPRRQMISDISNMGYSRMGFREHPGSVDALNPHIDIGYVSTQTMHEPSASSGPDEHDHSQSSSYSASRMLSPNIDNSRAAKAKRRESSLLLMDVNHQGFPTPFQGEHV